MIDTDLKQIIARLEKLEAIVFARPAQTPKIAPKENFSGAVGGLRLLLSEGFFSKKKTLSEVKEAFEANEYPYSVQVIQNALIRYSKKTGPLVSTKESGKKKMYGKRK